MNIDPLVERGHLDFGSAARHAVLEVPRVAMDDTVAQVLARMQGTRYACATHVVVCEGPRFAGVIRIEDLLAAPAGAAMGDLADRDAPTVAPGVDQEIAAWRAARHGESALCVVDADRRFLGVIPPNRVVAVLLSEHEEDLARLGGFLRGTADARASSSESVQLRLRHRLPWLLVGLAGALLSADLVGSFQARLQDALMLAFFIPGIVYIADAVGTQTETIVVRGLSLGVRLREMARQEVFSGIAIGITLALVGGVAVAWRWGDRDVALVVALTLFVSCTTATVVAMTLPWLLHRLRFDPAFGSGPLATVVQDLASIAVYFTIASWVLG